MKLIFVLLLALILVADFEIGDIENGDLSAERMRCEYLTDPLGIDVVMPRLSWIVVSARPEARDESQSAYRILVASSLEQLQKNNGDVWDSGKVNSDRSTFVVYGGPPLSTGAKYFWKVRIWDQQGRPGQWSTTATWSMGLLLASDWHGRWIGEGKRGNRQSADVAGSELLPSPWLRKTVTLNERPTSAMAYVNALGYFELYINGKKVEHDVLSPAVSDYSKRNYYMTYDVANYLAAGKNCIAIWLGRGWYVRGNPGVIHDGPLVRAQIDISMPDGKAAQIVTDESWKVRESPITPIGSGIPFGDYGGERYDSRKELAGWNVVKLDDSDWESAAFFNPSPALTAAQMVEPNRILETIKPVSVRKFITGGYLIDMGRNFTGWLEFRMPGGLTAGTGIKLEYADTLRSPNELQTYNQRDEVVARGGVGQIFRSRFNYHGFRYVLVTGLDHAPPLKNVAGYLIDTAFDQAGEFASSNRLLNRIYELVTRTYRALTLGGYVVDCPTRERLGYGGDAGTSLETGMFNFSSGGLYNKWLANWRDAQAATGDLPYTAPHFQDKGGGGPMWGGFVVTLPWQLYLQYGDQRVLETNYPMIQKWLGYLDSETVDHLLVTHKSYAMTFPEWNFLGDWVQPRPKGGKDQGQQALFMVKDEGGTRFIINLHRLYTVQLAAKIARILGKDDDALKYDATAATLGRVLHEKFFVADKDIYVDGEQAQLAFPLLVNVVPPELRAKVAKNLEQTILVHDAGHFNSGMHGTYFLLKYLMESGRNDLIYEMANKTDFPSWGYMLENGATTSWEAWDGSDSHIHDTFISIGSWFIQGIGGIRPDEKSPGFRHFFIQPGIGGDLTFARTSFQSPYGKIVSNWRIEKGGLVLNIAVPVGTTATVQIPSGSPGAITESGRRAEDSLGVRLLSEENGKAVYLVKSGKYVFESPMPNPIKR
ncbi:MAG TPA: family 78 glycoside hydrolase catalytic domain [Terriglobia bacterium]|nr:family 78 glycoside hydrolase catalytic domain [Terriglobia bacterium]